MAQAILSEDGGQDAIEYLLIIAGLVVATAAAFQGFELAISAILDSVCPGADPVGFAAGMACLTS